MADKDLDKFRKVLSSSGYRITNARETTFEMLASREPQSVRELLAKTKGQVDRVSVYRCLELFEKLGVVHRIYVGWKYKLELSDKFLSHHHHLSCLKCGRIIDIGDEKHINDFIEAVTREFGFEARSHQFEIEGYCSKCK